MSTEWARGRESAGWPAGPACLESPGCWRSSLSLTIQERELAPLRHFLKPPHPLLWAALTQFSMPQEAPCPSGLVAMPHGEGFSGQFQGPKQSSLQMAGIPSHGGFRGWPCSPLDQALRAAWGAPQSRVFWSRTISLQATGSMSTVGKTCHPLHPPGLPGSNRAHTCSCPLLGASTSSDADRHWDATRKA